MTDATRTVTASFSIPLTHAAMAGHFPGNPVVPGVVVLDHVIGVLASSGVPLLRMRRLRQVKFIEPLLPDQIATVTAAVGDAVLSFSVTRGDRTIAKGTFEVGSELTR